MLLYTKGILKLLYRFSRQRPIKTLRTIFSLERLLGTIWVESNRTKLDNLIKRIGEDNNLFIESKNFEKNFKKEKKETIKNLPISGGLKGSTGGGGGNEFILYYIVRRLKPNVVIESGVSAGISTRSILEALEKNKKGDLYSSDLQLYLDKKDEINLPIILKQINEIDIVYYDSGKSYSGKKIFFDKILSNFTPNVIIVDDIDRDYWFRDFTKKNSYDYIVVGNVGVIFLK